MTLRFDDPRLELAVRAAASAPESLTHLTARALGIRRLGGIEQLGELRWLDLGHNPLATVTELRANTKLRQLILQSTGMSTLRGLEGLTMLEDLDLYASRTLVIDELAGLPLRSLDLGLCIVPKLGPLATLTRLESLTLGNPKLHVPRRTLYSNHDPLHLDLAPLYQLSSLRQLRLYRLKLPSATVLAELVGLEELILEGCTFADQLRELPDLPRLELLSLAECELPDLQAVTTLPRLRVLDLDEAKVTDLEPLVGCPSLEQLSLRNTELGDRRSVHRMREIPTLIELRLDNRLISVESPA